MNVNDLLCSYSIKKFSFTEDTFVEWFEVVQKDGSKHYTYSSELEYADYSYYVDEMGMFFDNGNVEIIENSQGASDISNLLVDIGYYVAQTFGDVSHYTAFDKRTGEMFYLAGEPILSESKKKIVTKYPIFSYDEVIYTDSNLSVYDVLENGIESEFSMGSKVYEYYDIEIVSDTHVLFTINYLDEHEVSYEMIKNEEMWHVHPLGYENNLEEYTFNQEVQITANKLNVRSGPTVDSFINRVALKDEKYKISSVFIDEEENVWLNIGSKDWISGEYVVSAGEDKENGGDDEK